MNIHERNDIVYLDLSDSQYSEFGKFLGNFYYGGGWPYTLRTLLESMRKEYPNVSSGYPHNGGEHSLRLTLPRIEMLAFLEIAKDNETVWWHFNELYKVISNSPSQNRFWATKIWRETGLVDGKVKVEEILGVVQ